MSRHNPLSHVLSAAALAVLLFSAASVPAQTPAGGAPTAGATDKSTAGTAGGGAKKLSKADADGLRTMGNINVSEVAAGQIALDKSKNDHVMAYAKQMIDDHSSSQKELTKLAQDKGLTLPTEPDKKHQAAAKKLSALSGDEFDRAYMKEAGVQDHTQARKQVTRVRDKASDPDVKAAADKMLPMIEQHLKLAKEMPVGK